jgi:predicted transcriptional regulator
MSTQEQERVSVSVFVDPRDRDRLFELARRNERSASAELRRAIREHLERDQADEEDER